MMSLIKIIEVPLLTIRYTWKYFFMDFNTGICTFGHKTPLLVFICLFHFFIKEKARTSSLFRKYLKRMTSHLDGGLTKHSITKKV